MRSRFPAGRSEANPLRRVSLDTSAGNGFAWKVRSVVEVAGIRSGDALGASTGDRWSRIGVRSARASSRAWWAIVARGLAMK
jgi:hypothetical protein